MKVRVPLRPIDGGILAPVAQMLSRFEGALAPNNDNLLMCGSVLGFLDPFSSLALHLLAPSTLQRPLGWIVRLP